VITPATLTIAVASDLHAFSQADDSGARPSHLQIQQSEGLPGHHPIAGLLELIRSRGIHADLLLCPGDMGDKATPEAIAYAWKAMHRVKEALGADVLGAATGNHDVDSRLKYCAYDPEQVLKNLDPPYPFSDEALNNKYWARKFVILSQPKYRLVVLNSSGYHQGNLEEQKHGRVAPDTLDRLKAELQASTRPLINLLLCHHHPQQHSELKLGDYDVMKDGQQLLDIVGSGRFGRWLVVHGHKHHPKITYASGGALSPVVFSAGSLCASLYLELQTVCRNQFYLIHLDQAAIEKSGLRGHVTAWDWAPGKGWAPSGDGSGVPHRCGFGYRGDLYVLAQRVALSMNGSAMDWDALVQNIPDLIFLLPQDLLFLADILETDFELKVLRDMGVPRQIGRRI
jgi:Calcineurin-like phosphoesterase